MAHAEYQLTLPARTADDAAAVAAVLGKAKARIGMIPNMYARMANVPGCSRPTSPGMRRSDMTRG